MTRFVFEVRQKFEAVPREYIRIVPEPLRHTLEIYKYLTNLVFSVHTVSYGSSFFPFDLIEEEKTRSVTYGMALELG